MNIGVDSDIVHMCSLHGAELTPGCGKLQRRDVVDSSLSREIARARPNGSAALLEQ